MADLRVLLVADDPLARGGLAALLAASPGLHLVAQVTLDEAPSAAAEAGPEAVAWDPAGEAGASERLVAAVSPAPVVALVGRGTDAAELLRGGVRGLVDRGADGATVAAALAAAARGLAVLEPSLAAEWLRAPPAALAGPDALTPREREALSLLAEGLGNRAIAARLGVSEHTAKFHVNAILGKLGAATRAEAIVLAARRGLVAL
jgi:DNA-binding NarL/FixJ family response regulator